MVSAPSFRSSTYLSGDKGRGARKPATATRGTDALSLTNALGHERVHILVIRRGAAQRGGGNVEVRARAQCKPQGVVVLLEVKEAPRRHGRRELAVRERRVFTDLFDPGHLVRHLRPVLVNHQVQVPQGVGLKGRLVLIEQGEKTLSRQARVRMWGACFFGDRGAHVPAWRTTAARERATAPLPPSWQPFFPPSFPPLGLVMEASRFFSNGNPKRELCCLLFWKNRPL